MRFSSSIVIVAYVVGQYPSVALAANGCADGTFSRVQSPDGNATSFLFDDFSATAGGSSGVTRGSSTCRLNVPITQPDGHSVYAVDYRGFASTQTDQTARLVTLKDGTRVLAHQITGPIDEDIALSQRLGASGSSSLDLDVIVQAAGQLDPTSAEALIFVDSIDFARIGFTTTASVIASANQIATERQLIAIDLMGVAQNALGASSHFDEGSYIGGFVSSDAAAGFNGRWEAGNGVSLFGGAALVDPRENDTVHDPLALLAGAARYTTPRATWRGFGEIGAWGTPHLSADLSRTYSNLDRLVYVEGSASGSLIGSYVRIGVIFSPDTANELSVSTRFNRSWLNLGSYQEDGAGQNVFPARIKSGVSTADTITAEVAWSRKLDEQLDFTVTGVVGRNEAGRDGARASVDWVGDVTGSAKSENFAKLGGRIGWQALASWKLDFSVSATFHESRDARIDIGTAVKSVF